jgi:hypothetical protein
MRYEICVVLCGIRKSKKQGKKQGKNSRAKTVGQKPQKQGKKHIIISPFLVFGNHHQSSSSSSIER